MNDLYLYLYWEWAAFGPEVGGAYLKVVLLSLILIWVGQRLLYIYYLLEKCLLNNLRIKLQVLYDQKRLNTATLMMIVLYHKYRC